MYNKICFCGIVFLEILLLGCGTKNETLPPPNILWLSAEDISPAFACYGDQYASTPNIDKLAEDGIVFTNVYATAPICAPARSALITGIHATSMGTQHLRSEIPVPDDLKILPEFLKAHGYYCTNNAKTDYNFDPAGRWDENGTDAHWLNRKENTPFFSVFNYGTTHEGNTNKFDSIDIPGLNEYHDPTQAELPPYFPDTDEFRTIWAHAYDLITKFDMQVGERIEELRKAGELKNTIVFVFSDHGFGLPRYKRWNYKSGLHVPLVIYVPEKYKSYFSAKKGEFDSSLVSFADFAPTVMNLAGMEAHPSMQGTSFTSNNADKKKYVFGARSRADDVYDISRLVTDGRYLYIRNFMPYKAPIQKALIFDDSKRSFKELHRLKLEGKLNDTVMRMYQPKPSEELYDLKYDPYELSNLVGNPEYDSILETLRTQLKESLFEKKDIGFLHESEMMLRSKGSSPLKIAADTSLYNARLIIEAAFTASDKNPNEKVVLGLLKNPDSGVRFWGLNGVLNIKKPPLHILNEVSFLKNDNSPAVAILASEILILNGLETNESLEVLLEHLRDIRPWVALNSAITLRRIDAAAKPVLAEVKKEANKYYGSVGSGYSSWSYPMFIGFALDQVILNCE